MEEIFNLKDINLTGIFVDQQCIRGVMSLENTLIVLNGFLCKNLSLLYFMLSGTILNI